MEAEALDNPMSGCVTEAEELHRTATQIPRGHGNQVVKRRLHQG
jgi:hypothetical protein